MNREVTEAIQARLAAWDDADVARRIWEKDPTVWIADVAKAKAAKELADRLGWLTAPAAMMPVVGELTAFADDVRGDGYSTVVLLGMGGSSLAPEVFMRTFGHRRGYPALTVLDSTDPGAVQGVEADLDLATTLFLVSSKSGGTIETLSLCHYFYDRVRAVCKNAGRNFVAITDAGSSLEKLAHEREFRGVFHGAADVGGRYSALTCFGLVPAALIGVDVRAILVRGEVMAKGCGPDVPTAQNPGLMVGAALGELALVGRNKLTFFLSPSIAALGGWLEQLIAESTGKRGKGVLPVVDEPLGSPEEYGDDRVFVCLDVDDDDPGAADASLKALSRAGHPVLRFTLADTADVGAEFFRWEMATAAMGAVLEINPFDQPNVEAAKVKAREQMKAYGQAARAPAGRRGRRSDEKPAFVAGDLEVHGTATAKAKTLAQAADTFLRQVAPRDYVAVMAYVPPSPAVGQVLGELRRSLRARFKVATSVGYGPRFLHSTGQLYKGDGNHGLFIQVTHAPAADLAIPGAPYSFGTVIAAQAAGDRQALMEAGRRLLRLHVRGDVVAGLRALCRAVARS